VATYDPDKHCGGQKARAPKGDLCTRPKGWGTNHPGVGRCKRHGGSTPTHNEAARRELLVRDCQVLGLPQDIDPETALIEAVKEAAGNVAFYRAMVQQLPAHPEADRYVSAQEAEEEAAEAAALGIDVDREEDAKGYWKRGKPGLYGLAYHVSGLPTGEAKRNIVLQMYDDERQRLVQFASVALQRGVEQRVVKLAERDAQAVAQAQIDTLIALGLSDRLEEFRAMFYERLQSHIPEPVSLSA
jgi:hypothetical protein